MASPLLSRWNLALGGIIAVALLGLLWAQSLGFPLDVDHYKYWTRLVTEQGVQAAYSGEFPHTYAIYPPVNLYFYWAIGQVYRAAIDPAFDMARALSNGTLTSMIKIPGILFHLLTMGLIYFWVSRKAGKTAGLLSSAAYGLQPGIIFDIAVWGQPDSVHAFFTVLTVVFLTSGQVAFGGASFAVAVLTKPQTWILAPLFLFYAWRKYGLPKLAVGGLSGAIASAVISAPFLLYGAWPQLITLPSRIASVAPSISANAHNIWWLLLGQRAINTPDSAILRFGLSYANIALALAGFSVIVSIFLLDERRSLSSLAAIAAFQSFAFFMVITKAHENHAFLALPLLSLVLAKIRELRPIFFILSFTFLANVVLHDPVAAPFMDGLFGGHLSFVQRLDAGINVALLVGWTMLLFLSRNRPSRSAAKE